MARFINRKMNAAAVIAIGVLQVAASVTSNIPSALFQYRETLLARVSSPNNLVHDVIDACPDGIAALNDCLFDYIELLLRAAFAPGRDEVCGRTDQAYNALVKCGEAACGLQCVDSADLQAAFGGSIVGLDEICEEFVGLSGSELCQVAVTDFVDIPDKSDVCASEQLFEILSNCTFFIDALTKEENFDSIAKLCAALAVGSNQDTACIEESCGLVCETSAELQGSISESLKFMISTCPELNVKGDKLCELKASSPGSTSAPTSGSAKMLNHLRPTVLSLIAVAALRLFMS